MPVVSKMAMEAAGDLKKKPASNKAKKVNKGERKALFKAFQKFNNGGDDDDNDDEECDEQKPDGNAETASQGSTPTIRKGKGELGFKAPVSIVRSVEGKEQWVHNQVNSLGPLNKALMNAGHPAAAEACGNCRTLPESKEFCSTLALVGSKADMKVFESSSNEERSESKSTSGYMSEWEICKPRGVPTADETKALRKRLLAPLTDRKEDPIEGTLYWYEHNFHDASLNASVKRVGNKAEPAANQQQYDDANKQLRGNRGNSPGDPARPKKKAKAAPKKSLGVVID